MNVITVRNVHEALPIALLKLQQEGVERPSRNGPVLQLPVPMATVYERPCERVMFWPERDANPFLHLYEALWMLAGRNDIAPLCRYAPNFINYSDDGKTQHAAYGYRWRKHFGACDQLKVIAEQLRGNATDRRCVLAMWDPASDLGVNGKDLPCNDTATFQIGVDGRLDLVVFCRSNDIIWGCYGANAVHFSMLLEYMSAWIGVPVGTYTQISVNWHGYLATLEKVKSLTDFSQVGTGYPNAHLWMGRTFWDPFLAIPYGIHNGPKRRGQVRHLPMSIRDGHVEAFDEHVHSVLSEADRGFKLGKVYSEPWFQMVYKVLRAHQDWKDHGKDFAVARLDEASESFGDIDWVVVAKQWLLRRKT